MRKTLLLLLLLITTIAWGSANDSEKIVRLQREVSVLKSRVSHLRQEDSKLRTLYQTQSLELDSLKNIQRQQAGNMAELANKMGADLTKANKKIDDNVGTLSDSINLRTWLAVCGIIIAMALLGIVYSILRKKILRGSSSIDKIRAAQESLETAQKALQAESVKLDNKLMEMLSDKMGAMQKVDHSFALKVGDEIARIETNLSKMDKNVRGYNQLKGALQRIKDNFNAHGYEIVELLGLDYNDGMPFEAQFVPDDTLPEGKRIISGITRLQINYNGEMIQSAKITVRQNI